MIASLFPTPIYYETLKDNKEINNNLLFAENLRKIDPGIQKSNFGGWHSSIDFIPNKEFEPIGNQILNHINIFLTQLGYNNIKISLNNAWFIINKNNDFNNKHTHPRSFISGVYYIKVPANASPIIFHNNNPAKEHTAPEKQFYSLNTFTNDAAKFDVEESKLILFPGWLQHSVPVSENMSGERVCLSFNFVI